MVGTGANRMPLTKVHPILLGQQKSSSNGSSLLSQYRQQHQERRQQASSPSSPQQFRPTGHQEFNQQHDLPSQQRNDFAPPYGQHQFSSNNFQQTTQSQFNFKNYNQPPMNNGNTTNTTEGGSDGSKRKRSSRWGAKEEKANMTGLVTLPADLTEEQRVHYLVQFKIEEISQKLRTGDLGIPADPGARSPSPEPIYNSEGKRLNTREYRVRKQLEEERHTLIKKAIEEIPNYKPPLDYKAPTSKIQDKVFIPAERNPAVNFIGLLIGPRGNTLRRLEKETGCKIIIRGKGSVKEGKVGRIPGQLMPGEDEPLHALITGPSEKEVRKGVEVVAAIVKEGVECPDAANELRRNQLRELAELNGTLIDEELIKCKNCGATDHKHWECQEQRNVTALISCHNCGGYGHVAADCKIKHDVNSGPMQTFAEKAKMDTEYMSLMAELGVEGPPAKKEPPKLPDPSKEHYDTRSKWGPPAGNNPKSIGDIQTNNLITTAINSQFRVPQPGVQANQSSVPPPWVNQQYPIQQNRPFTVAPPWQQSLPRGGPSVSRFSAPLPGYGLPAVAPVGGMITGYPQIGWQQQMYGTYNPYQQPPAPPSTNPPAPYAVPPPPWTQQPPPPPPPPPPSS
ncbi:splicing factor 1 isoform X1 [Hydra vulgaris]|uniref:splicing factor 1 isoform X1 n=1 Tax=Hydra vulgaris TaxID=6087 RepID=UPI000192590B|nr:splicing factor 1 [Hydra vulgaris]